MKKTLYILRHGKAVDESSKITDFDRYLTEKGEEEAKLIGDKLNKLKVKPDLIISSPARRALDTAIVTANCIKYPVGKIRYEKNIYNAYIKDMLNVITNIDDQYSKVMICGHNPSFTDLVMLLSDHELLESLPKGAIAGIEFAGSSWTDIENSPGKIVLFETPKMQKR